MSSQAAPDAAAAPARACAEPPVYKRHNLLMFIVLVGVFMSVLDGIVVNIALPTITTHFGTELAKSQWTITAYLLTTTSTLMIFGKISERTGRVRLFMTGFTIFVIGSFACGSSASLEQLVSFRILQALGASMVFSISSAMLFEIAPRRNRGRAMGYLGTTVAVGSIAGPALGGFIVDALGWSYIFLINVPIGVLLLVLAAKYMKLNETRSPRLDMDWIGAGSLVAFMGSLILFLGDLSDTSAITPAGVTYAAVFASSLAAFLLRESRCKSPLLDLSVFRVRGFSMPSFSMLLFFISSFMVSLVGPFYFEGVMAFSPSQVGIIYMITPVIMMIASPISGSLFDKHHWRYHASVGVMVVAAALALLGFMALAGILALMAAAYALQGFGGSLFQSPNNTELMGALPPHQRGVASSVSATFRNLGMSLGVSFASILVAFQLRAAGYHGAILEADRVLLAGVVSNVIFVAAALCVAAAAVSLMRSGAEACDEPRQL